MNQTQALSTLKRLVGPKLGYRVDNKAPGAEEREQLITRKRETAARVRAILEALDARRQAVLAADAEYQRLRAEHQAAKSLHEAIPSPYHKRITVGRVGSLFFSVIADGDNWAEVVEATKAKLS